MRLTQAEAELEDGHRPVWLLTLTLPDGRALRMASRPMRVLTRRGAVLSFDPFLAGVSEFDEEVDVFSLDGVGALTQAQVEIVTSGTALGALQGDWHHVTAATAELALLWDGQVWDDRLVALAGGIAGAEFGLADQVSTLSLETTPPATSETIGDDARDVGADWPTPTDTTGAQMSDLEGRKYVHVYGAAKSIPAYKVGEVASSGTNRLILCGHHLPRSGASYPVTVYEDGASGTSRTVINGTINGKEYAYVEGADFLSTDGAYTWDATYGGIAAADGADRPALGAEGVIRRLLVDSGLAVDWRSTEPALARLRDWRIAIYTDQEATAIEVLRDRVLRHLPVIEMNSGEGLWLAYCDPHVAVPEAHLTLGQQLLGRVGRMGVSDLEAIRNAFTVNYAPEATSGELVDTVTLDASTSALCALSQQLYGVRADTPIDCDATDDATTALRIAGARASRLALPRRVLTYELAPELYWLRARAVVTLTDAGYGVARQRAVCTRVSRTMVPFRARFELVDRTPVSGA